MTTELQDDDVVAWLTVKVARSGALAVSGCVGDEMFAIACLEQAIQSVKDFHKRKRGESCLITPHIVPAYDSPLAH